ncbi:MAG TPA: hypothetical protein VLB50_10870, partial [Ignavibacteriaceae bacterium]|nr:hypothetical protein [Ignavibacteriaceae bacterium]
ATELNNQGFEVERQRQYAAGKKWEKIGFVPGFGTTTEPKSYNYSDQSVKNGAYYYRLKQVDFNGSYNYSDAVKVELKALNSYFLDQNWPNPFNPTTTIGFGIQNKSNVKITILNAIGEEVVVLLNEEKEPGYHQVEFNGANLPSGVSVKGGYASGVYFYQLVATPVGGQAGNSSTSSGQVFIQSKKMILLK